MLALCANLEPDSTAKRRCISIDVVCVVPFIRTDLLLRVAVRPRWVLSRIFLQCKRGLVIHVMVIMRSVGLTVRVTCGVV